MLQLRLTRGINIADFTMRTGDDARSGYRSQLQALGSAGLLKVNEDGFRLTDRGIDLADAVAAEFI
jgi:oxygen-independent coproporphyrinogen III oxidase